MATQELTLNQRAMADPEKFKWRALIGSFLGYTFDAQDYMILALALPLIIKDWGISLTTAGLLGTVSLFGAAIGALIWGPISDKYGRKPVLVGCLIWFGLFTVLCGCAQNFTQLCVFRFITGLGLGGEWVLGAALITEFFPTSQRARATSAIQSAWPTGYAVAIGANALLATTYGWRAMFFSGVVVIIAIIFIIVWIPESPAWLKRKTDPKSVNSVTPDQKKVDIHWTDIFKGSLFKSTLLCSLLAIGLYVSYWGSGTWLPAYLANVRGLNVSKMSGYLLLLNAAGFCGYYAFGWFADKAGRRMNFIVGALLSAAVVLAYMAASTPSMVMFMGALFGFITYGYLGPMGAYFGEQYPTAIRGVGISITYGAGRFGAAFAPVILGGIATAKGLTFAIGLVSVFYVLAAVAAFFMKETKNLETD